MDAAWRVDMRGKDLAGKHARALPGRRSPAPGLTALALLVLLFLGDAGRALAVSRIDRPGVYALGAWGQ